jgi:pilus assembly protein Flp/PilA
MKQIVFSKLRATCGQDLMEFALMAGFLAMAAGAVMPGVASSISTIFSQVNSMMAATPPTGAE